MNVERAIPRDTPSAADTAADDRADADLRAGRVVEHSEVAAWLSRWGTADETPAPPEWLA